MNKVKEKLDSILKQKDKKDHVYNFVKEVDYKVSSGSLKLDIEMEGGLSPGLARFSGGTESGKTSCALTFAKKHQETTKDGFVVYFKAEGRLSKKMLERHGLDPEKLYVVESNVYEVVIDTMRELVNNNPEGVRYFFIIDSVDGCIRKEDLEKATQEAVKVAGGALLTSEFLKRMTLKLGKLGHVCILIHQNRSKIQLNQYEKRDSNNITQSSGGNAGLHYSDWIFEFMDKNIESCRIRGAKADSADADPKGEIIGHFCRISFRKTPNEKTNKIVSYPVRYGTKDGNTIWVEYEVLQILQQFGFLKKAGPWFKFEEDALSQLEASGIKDVQKQFQGETKTLDYLSSRKDIVEYYYEHFKSTFI
jgi:RecA/RadA recombinase|tara:strand:- start:1163 stop:2251 length:1089 start_codon:yes stop_codon:yes gene_type:complete